MQAYQLLQIIHAGSVDFSRVNIDGPMTLTEFRYLVALAKTGHFGQAARQCHVSQPTLSIAIKKLEDELGVTLFERSKSQLTPTQTGLKIIQQAEVLLAQVEVIRELADSGRDPFHSPLRLGAIYTIGPYLFPHLVPELTSRAANMPLFIEEGYTANLKEKLLSCELDAIVIALPFQARDVLSKTLYEEPFVVLLPKEHPLTGQATIKPADLQAEEILLLGEGHCFRDQILTAFPDLLSQGPGIEHSAFSGKAGTSLETLKLMVSSGLGITILPLSAASLTSYNREMLTVRPFAAPAPQRSVALAWRASFPRHQAIELLSQAARQCQIFH